MAAPTALDAVLYALPDPSIVSALVKFLALIVVAIFPAST